MSHFIPLSDDLCGVAE